MVLLGVEAELIVVRYDAEAAVERVGAVNDDRNAPLLALGIQRMPVRLVHARRFAPTTRIRAGIGSNKPEVLHAPLELAEDVGRVRRFAELRQLRGADEPLREVLDLRVDAVVDEPRPVGRQVLLHEAHDAEGAGSNDLDVDIASVHVVHVAL